LSAWNTLRFSSQEKFVNPILLFSAVQPRRLPGGKKEQKSVKMRVIVESGGVLGLTGNYFGRRQRVEGHPLVKRVEATTTADNNYALAA
jgi:hypothetical protein